MTEKDRLFIDYVAWETSGWLGVYALKPHKVIPELLAIIQRLEAENARLISLKI